MNRLMFPNNFVGYEYKEINVSREKTSFCPDCYRNFGWILPYFLYEYVVRQRTRKSSPLIDAKYEEIYKICEKGYSLL
ncbi:MAG: hypothetical protein ACI4HN_06840 [Ruminococcus sp.]